MATISGLLYDDNNINGVFEGAVDTVVSNKEIKLFDRTGNFITSTTTDSDGRYTFGDLAAGDYLVGYSPGLGVRFSPQDVGDNDAIDSDVNSNGVTDPISVTADEVVDGVNIGCYKLGRIGDRVFEDTNNNGLQDDGEPGVGGVEVVLQSPDGTTVATTTSNDNGDYEFDIIEPGDYKVTFNAPDGREFTIPNAGNDDIDSDADPNTGMTEVFPLDFGQNQTTIDAGLKGEGTPVEAASLGDRVFLDANSNGIQDGGDSGVTGAVVILLDANGTEVRRTTTNGDGDYLFSDLEPGNYQVQFEIPEEATGFTTPNVGDDTTDSDANANGLTDVISLESGENNLTVDAGVVKEDVPEPQTGSIGDFVFNDANENGIQDEGEQGVSGVTVTLTNPEGTVNLTDVTDATGIYTFDNLAPDDYKITVDAPEGFNITTPNVGDNDAIDSDVDPTNSMSDFVSLAAGENIDTLDAGIVEQPVTPTTGSIGDFVFNDANENGIQDEGEQGVSGVTVTLTNPEGTVNLTDVTDATGIYTFDNLAPDDYKITVDAPEGFNITTPNVGDNDAIDSDVDPTNSMSDFVSLAAGENIDTLDAGIVEQPVAPETGSIGDFVFNDANENGIQDEGEQGVSGVTVTLTNPEGTVNLTDVTDANGIYTFDGLAPDDYKITVDAPEGFEFTIQDAGENGAIDSDVNPTNGMSDFVPLAAGENLDILDAGLVEILEPVDINPAVDIEKLVRVEGEGGPEGVDLCTEFGDPVGLIFEYVGGPSVNNTAQSIATVNGPAIGDANVGIISTIPTVADPVVADPVVFVGGTGKGKVGKGGKGKSGSISSNNLGGFNNFSGGKGGKGGKGKGGVVNPFPNNPIPPTNPTPANPDGTPIALGETFVVRPDGLDTLNIEIEGASGTQNVTYDASCNEPIRLGDQIGNLRLVGFEGTNGSTRLGGSSSSDLDADDAPGPDALVGDNIVFTYTVANDGDTPLDIEVTDNRITPNFVGGDDNNNGLLDVNEVFTYTANEAAGSGLQTNIGTVEATAVDANGNPIPVPGDAGGAVVTVTDTDAANYTGVAQLTPIEIPNTPITVPNPNPNPNPPVPQGDLCDVLGKPNTLDFVYRPSNGVNTLQEKFELDGFADDDDTAFIVGGGGKGGKGGKGKGGFTGGITGGQQVSTGETITVNVTGSSTDIAIADEQGGPVIQTVDYHTSCSDIIQLGDQIGSLTLVGYNGEDGSFALTQEQIDSLPVV